MVRAADSPFANEVFTYSLGMVLRHMWPDGNVSAETIKDPMTMATLIRFRVPTKSGRVMFVTDKVTFADEAAGLSWRDYTMSPETIATITLLLG